MYIYAFDCTSILPQLSRFMYHRLICTLFSVLCFGLTSNAQEDSTRFFVETGGVTATSQHTPFWLRSNQFGSVPLSNPFVFVKTGAQAFIGTKPRKAQLHLQGEIIANVGRTSSVILPVASATFRHRQFEAYVGRRKEFFGLGDTLLSSGSYAWSGNALPIPKVHIGTRGFVSVPFTKDILAFHATFSHGWFGRQDSVRNYYLHQKSFHGRIGKPTWKVNFFLGLLHYVQWGGTPVHPIQGVLTDGKYPSSFKDYLYLTIAKSPEGTSYSEFETFNQIGNHLGSIDLAFSYKQSHWDVLLYHQHPYEDKSGLAFTNFPDGLYGLRLKNAKANTGRGLHIAQVTLEYLTTLDKGNSMNPDLRNRYEPDPYFRHAQYTTDWTYNHFIIGTPFFTRYFDMNPALIAPAYVNKLTRGYYVANNSVELFHAGLDGTIGQATRFSTRISYSNNFPEYFKDVFAKANQFSYLATFIFPWKKYGLETKATIAFDYGQLFDKNLGMMFSVKKKLF